MAAVELSEQSQELITQLSQLVDNKTLRLWKKSGHVARSKVIAWLTICDTPSPDQRFIIESLRVSLLDDVQNSLLTPEDREARKKKKKSSRFNQAGFIALVVAGSFVALCEGFDGVANILGLFSAIPTLAVFFAGVVFSLLSLSLFYGFELMEISERAGVNLRKSRKLLDVFLEQVEQINELRKIVETRFAKESISTVEREELKRIALMLRARYEALDSERENYLHALNSPGLKIARFLTAGMTSILFFSSGYFTGQTLALTVAGLFLSSVVPTFWPIVAVSVAVGLAALVIYWTVHRSSLENLVGQFMGLSRENINAFADESIVTEQRRELHKLHDNVTSVDKMQKKLFRLESNAYLNKNAYNKKAPPEPECVTPHSFFPRPRTRSLNALDELRQSASGFEFNRL